jgi:hypothetical protein
MAEVSDTLQRLGLRACPVFDAQRYRTGEEKILMLGLTEDEESSLGE